MYEIDIEGEISLLENGDLYITCTTLSLEEAKKRISWLKENSVLQLCTLFTLLQSGELMFASDFDFVDAFAMGIPEYENDTFFGGETMYYYEFLEEWQYLQLLMEGELTLPLVC